MYYEWEKHRESVQAEEKGDILLTLVLIVAIAVFCYAAVNLFIFTQNTRKEQMNITTLNRWQ